MARLPPGLPALLALQLAAEGAVLGVDWALTGSVSLLLPGVASALASGAYGFLLRRSRRCTRAALRRLGLAAGLVHVPLGALVYAAAWSRAPDIYEFGAAGLPLAAACVGLLVGGLVFVGASCALDLGAHVGGGVEDAEPVRRSFREPPG